jgi:exo-beta-1,3-glucanase (GH17 family)
MNKLTIALLASTVALFGCGDEIKQDTANTPAEGGGGNEQTVLVPQPQPLSYPTADNGDALLGNSAYPAVSYGSWRSTIRESGANVPTVEMQKEDMKILAAMGIKIIRTYNTRDYINPADGKSNTENLLEAIAELKEEDDNFEMYVMLGAWIQAHGSWDDETPNDRTVEHANNALEIAKAKELALAYPDIVKVIAVGNEAMVDWAGSYNVVPGIILDNVNDLQQWKTQDESTQDLWITSSDNFAVWSGSDVNGNQGDQTDLKALINAVDYVSAHTYAMHDTHYNPTFKEEWKVPVSQQDLSVQEQVDFAMERAYEHTIEQIAAVQEFVNSVDPSKPIHIGETGWTSISSDGLGEGGTGAAGEYQQKLFHDDMREWSENFGASLFFFQAFDEPWKGGTNNPSSHSEKNFGLIDIDCNVKFVAWDHVQTLNDLGLDRDCNAGFNASYGEVVQNVVDDINSLPLAPEPTEPVEGEFRILGATAFAGAVDWEGTAWPGIDEVSGILTVTPAVPAPKSWGWGAMIGDNQNRDLSSKSTISFEIRGYTDNGRPLAEFAFGVGFQTDYGEWGTNHSIKFNNGTGYTLTNDWQTVTIDIASDLPASLGELTKVKNPLIVHHTSIDGNLTESDIQLRNISWFD